MRSRHHTDAPSPSNKKKRKTDRTSHASSEPIIDTPENPKNIYISDAETQSGNEHEHSDNVNDDVHDHAQPSNDNYVEIKPAVDHDNPQSKNQRCDKRDFVARKHGKERESWIQKPMPFPLKPSKKKDDEDLEEKAWVSEPMVLFLYYAS